MQNLAQSMTGITLRTLSTPLRLLFSSFLVTIGLGYLAALGFMFLVDVDPHQRMGMNVVEGIIMKYYGQRNNTRLEAALRGSMANRIGAPERDQIMEWIADGSKKEPFEANIRPLLEKNCVMCHNPKSGIPIPPLTNYDEVLKVGEPDTGQSLSSLARLSHVHLFGISLIFLLTGGIFALTEIRPWVRDVFIVIPYAAIWVDIGSWWVTKYAAVFGYTVVIGGGLMGVALAVQILVSLWEMWLAKPKPTELAVEMPPAG